jgi:hypothetical protein
MYMTVLCRVDRYVSVQPMYLRRRTGSRGFWPKISESLDLFVCVENDEVSGRCMHVCNIGIAVDHARRGA